MFFEWRRWCRTAQTVPFPRRRSRKRAARLLATHGGRDSSRWLDKVAGQLSRDSQVSARFSPTARPNTFEFVDIEMLEAVTESVENYRLTSVVLCGSKLRCKRIIPIAEQENAEREEVEASLAEQPRADGTPSLGGGLAYRCSQTAYGQALRQRRVSGRRR
jgi:hypothetical protein